MSDATRDMISRRWARRLGLSREGAWSGAGVSEAIGARVESAARALVDEALVSDDVGCAADAEAFVASQLSQSWELLGLELRERIALSASSQIRRRLAAAPALDSAPIAASGSGAAADG